MKHQARKRFGQNFLTDDRVIQRIVDVIDPRDDQLLLEIGPGQAAITAPLAASGVELHLVELDRDLVAFLAGQFKDNPKVFLHEADALSVDFAQLTGNRPFRLVGNLPYNISTPLIFKLLESTARIRDMHFMLQLEVVDRLAAGPGNRNWGRLGIMAQYLCQVEKLFEVPPEAFTPRPRVQSAVVRLAPWQESPWPACDAAGLRRVVQAAFGQRRKTLRNNLKGLIDTAGLERLGVDPGTRAEALTLPQFIEITNAIHG